MALLSRSRKTALTAAIASALLMRQLLFGSAGNRQESFAVYATPAGGGRLVASRSPGLRCVQLSRESQVKSKAQGQLASSLWLRAGASNVGARDAVRPVRVGEDRGGSRGKPILLRAGVDASGKVRWVRTHLSSSGSEIHLLTIAPRATWKGGVPAGFCLLAAADGSQAEL